MTSDDQMRLNPLLLPTILLAALLFLVGGMLDRRAHSYANRMWLYLASVCLAAPGTLFVLYYIHLFDNAVWFYNFRALPFTELAASGLGFAAGVVQSRFEPISLGEKATIPAVLLAMILVPHVKPLFVPLDVDRLSNSCPDAVCLQSTLATCGPASAATILKTFGYEASEKQLATECFTYRGGTESWYLARAFERRHLDARFIVVDSPDRASFPTPAIAGVTLRGPSGHFVAVLKQTATDVTVADPMKGLMVIQKSELRQRYHFTGFFLTVQRRRG